jgi:hypothetical protein
MSEYIVYIDPQLTPVIQADSVELKDHVLKFKRGNEIVGQFRWAEIRGYYQKQAK